MARFRRHPSILTKTALFSLALSGCLASSALAQQPGTARHSRATAIKPPAVVISPVQPSVEILPAPRPLTPEQMPPVAPQVVWDGEQLSISAENSTLGSVLEAVKQATGADIDVPPAAARERLVIHVGPGPAREVLSSLLSGTSYDYVIQAADDNPLGIQNIFLSARSKPGASSADSRGAMMAAQPRRRFGSSNPVPSETADSSEDSNPVAQVPLAAPEAGEPSSTTAAQAATTTPAPAQPPATTAAAAQSPLPGDPKPAASATSSMTADANPANTDAQGGSTDAVQVQADLTPPPVTADSGNRPMGMREQKVMEMQNLFEQRKKMQEQALKGNQTN